MLYVRSDNYILLSPLLLSHRFPGPLFTVTHAVQILRHIISPLFTVTHAVQILRHIISPLFPVMHAMQILLEMISGMPSYDPRRTPKDLVSLCACVV